MGVIGFAFTQQDEVFHQQIYDETFAKIRSKVKPPMIWLWFQHL